MIQELLKPLVCQKFLSDAKYREGHLKVLNPLPGRKVLGMHSPETKAIAKRLAHEEGEQLIADFEAIDITELCYEEMAIWGFMINIVKCPIEHKLKMLEKYVPVIDNWGLCDSYVAHAKWMKKVSPDELLKWTYGWFCSDREFEVRFAIIVSMCYLMDSKLDDIFKEFDIIDFDKIKSDYISVRKRPAEIQSGCVLGPKPYYVRMAVAWFLATALARYPDKTREYVRCCNLPKDVLRLYVRKARESFRTRDVQPF